MMRSRTAWLLFALLVVVLGSFLLWPLFKVIGGGCFVDGRFTPEYLLGVFRNPIYAEGLLNIRALQAYVVAVEYVAACILLERGVVMFMERTV